MLYFYLPKEMDCMKDLIKYIREYCGYSQEQFAKILNTSFSTVNRWENGHTTPTSLAQSQLYQVCRDMDVDITEYILGEIKKQSINLNKEITLYHGSNGGIKGKIIPKSRSVCDFGCGFYMGTNPMQPLTLIASSEKPVFYRLRMNTLGLKVKKFGMDIEWALAIAYNRGYMDDYKDSDIYKKYKKIFDTSDLAVGPIADDKMFSVMRDFFNLRITDEALINSLSALDYGMQYVALTEKACKQIKVETEKEIPLLEKMVWQDKAGFNREEAEIETGRITMKYRRVGKYFDEIMDEI